MRNYIDLRRDRRLAEIPEGQSTTQSAILRAITICGVFVTVLTAAGCSSADQKNYDIAPIFPLSSGKCAKYHGDEKGSGITARCMVTKAECERAAADWKQAMQSGGVNDAILFTCN